MKAQPVTTRVALYARVAQQDQSRIERQIAALRRHAAANEWPVAAVYADNGLSGIRLERPGLDRLREDARGERFTHLLLTGPDRLSRSPAHLAALVDELRALDVDVIWTNPAVEEPIG